MTEKPLSITEFTKQLKLIIQTEFSEVYLTGEISNFKRNSASGHCYFTLKDENAALSAALWSFRYQYLKFKPADGMKVEVRGKITIYEPRGSYQIDISEIKPAGIGELQLAFERLKEKLEKEGFFDESRKRELPEFPERVAIITSDTGAVIEDFKRVTRKRFPLITLLLFPARVQGAGSLESVISALKEANKPEYEADVIVLARGGGSIEDLWTFNEEALARELFKSRIPIVSAIGHDTDYTICDFVADRRAATPSAAAEIILPDKNQLLERINQIDYYIKDEAINWLKHYENILNRFESSYVFNRPLELLNQYKIRLDENYKEISGFIRNKMNSVKEKLNYSEKLFLNIGPEQTLKRGFTYVKRDGKIISRKKNLKSRDEVDIIFYDGESKALIKEKSFNQNKLF
ncbi:MAG: exodeoxyribonuclease VII large subunit [Ignavibacteria bacterium]|nr:exodeoxyribonuclease VII large subunit [Ignavibacteria bacterium]